MSEQKLFTVGHSNHEAETFLSLLSAHGVAVICDVRSHPYSKMYPQYDRETLRETLGERGIKYGFLGKELGARSDDPACYIRGKVSYARLAATENYRGGLERLMRTAETQTVALLCAEKDPVTCHRTILVCRSLRDLSFDIGHILADGGLETQEALETRLLQTHHLDAGNLFFSRDEMIEQAYDRQAEKIGYVQKTGGDFGESDEEHGE